MEEINTEPGRVIIFDDHSLFAYTISIALRQHGLNVNQFDVLPETTQDDIVLASKKFKPDVAVLDLHLGSAIANARPLIPRLAIEGTRVIIVTADKDETELAGCIFDGATCVLGKEISFDVFVTTIIRVLNGETIVPVSVREDLIKRWKAHQLSKQAALEPFERLTPREQEVLSALVAGKPADVIAKDSYMSLATVRSHIHSILSKLQVRSQLEAVAKAIHANWNETTDHA